MRPTGSLLVCTRDGHWCWKVDTHMAPFVGRHVQAQVAIGAHAAWLSKAVDPLSGLGFTGDEARISQVTQIVADQSNAGANGGRDGADMAGALGQRPQDCQSNASAEQAQQGIGRDSLFSCRRSVGVEGHLVHQGALHMSDPGTGSAQQ